MGNLALPLLCPHSINVFCLELGSLELGLPSTKIELSLTLSFPYLLIFTFHSPWILGTITGSSFSLWPSPPVLPHPLPTSLHLCRPTLLWQDLHPPKDVVRHQNLTLNPSRLLQYDNFMVHHNVDHVDPMILHGWVMGDLIS